MNYLYLAVNVLISLPYATLLIFISLILFGYKDKININGIVTFTIILGLLDAFLTAFIDPTGSIHAIIEPLVIIILFFILFRIEILPSLVMSFASFITYMFLAIPFVSAAKLIIGFAPGNPNSAQPSQFINVLAMYTIYLIVGSILFFLYKKDFKIINLQRFKSFNKTQNLYKQQEILKYILVFSIPLFICIAVNYSIYVASGTSTSDYAYTYFLVNFFALITSFIIMSSLIRKIVKLNFIESEYKLQQSYMNNIDRLTKDLRAQRHGFNNHINMVSALLQSKKYDSAREYILKMHQVVSCKNDVLSVNNPTLCALLNIKGSYAQEKSVKFEINMNDELSEMNFSAYELVEILGNVIDNAIEAASKGYDEEKYVKINISSDGNHYIFNVENSGKTIPPQIIEKLFEEGFTTKQNEPHAHGFGLYICKHLLEIYNGKIDVQSVNNITNFKIHLPVVMKNEFGLS